MAILRSGGDYHFISRTLHPSLGFMSSVNWALWLPLVLGWIGANVPLIALQSLLTAWGAVTNNPALIELAATLLNPDTMFLIGAIVIIAFTAIIILGTKIYLIIQNISFAFMLAAIAITFGAFILNDPNPFAASIDRLMGPNTYQSMYVYTDWLRLFSQLFAVAFSFFSTAISAIVFPFRRKEMFGSSPARIRIGKIPVMSLMGLANAIFLIVFMYQNWVDDMLGSNHPVSITLILGILIIFYWIIRAIRRSQGIDIDALFIEIPPE